MLTDPHEEKKINQMNYICYYIVCILNYIKTRKLEIKLINININITVTHHFEKMRMLLDKIHINDPVNFDYKVKHTLILMFISRYNIDIKTKNMKIGN